jgi:hypothetical protein
MNGALKVDVIIVALILSIAGHLGLMYWARQKVMTQVAPPELRTHRRAPMTITRADKPQEPAAFELIEDLPAQKEAPAAEESRLSVPTPSGDSLQAHSMVPVPVSVEVPDVLSRLRPEAEKPVLPEAKPAEPAKTPAVLASMPVEVFAPKPILSPVG